jgi:hypothetical protein
MITNDGLTIEERFHDVLRKSTKNESGCGCYQIMAVIFIKLGILSAGFIVYGLTFW